MTDWRYGERETHPLCTSSTFQEVRSRVLCKHLVNCAQCDGHAFPQTSNGTVPEQYAHFSSCIHQRNIAQSVAKVILVCPRQSRSLDDCFLFHMMVHKETSDAQSKLVDALAWQICRLYEVFGVLLRFLQAFPRTCFFYFVGSHMTPSTVIEHFRSTRLVCNWWHPRSNIETFQK